MEYKRLAELYDSLEATTLKLEKTKIVAQFLESVKSADELKMVVLLISGRVYPGWSSQELGMSSGLMVKAVSKAYGINPKEIEVEWRKLGDLGLVTEKYSSKKSQSRIFTKMLTVQKVFDNLRKISGMEGMKSQDRKLDLVSELLSSVSDSFEARYIARTVIGDLRVGVAEGLLRDAIASAFFANIYWKETLEQKANGDIRLKILSQSLKGKKKKILVDEKLDSLLAKKHDEDYNMLKSGNEVVVKEIKKVSDDELSKKKSGIDYIFFSDVSIGNETKSRIVSSVEHAFSMTNDFSLVAAAAKEGGLPALQKLDMTANHPLKVMLYQKAMTIEDAFKIVGKPAAIEYKYDGFRLQIHKTDSNITLFTRRLENVTEQFPDVKSIVRENVKAKSFIVDCEVIGI
ncbi:MAG: hypothetical protein KAI51_00775, partial [Candidatus Aenigmarchaeota archaeon]|nr:hypothetical protein [Candidatus Aenigmarchaeota archaeon]